MLVILVLQLLLAAGGLQLVGCSLEVYESRNKVQRGFLFPPPSLLPLLLVVW
jgi:hypothetical protein